MKKEKHEEKNTEEQQEPKPDPKDEKIAELTETLQRLQAEFENYKKYVDKEKACFVQLSNRDLLLKILPVVDSFEIALKNTQDKEKFLKGIELIFAQLYSIMESSGLKPIECLNKKFDPYYHEVLLKEKRQDLEEGTIIEELQKGYMINGKVLRYSKVKISTK